MVRALLACLLLVAIGSPARSRAEGFLPTLKNGQSLHITGRLDTVYRGWHRYLVLRIPEHLADFGPKNSPVPITALELDTPGQSEILAEHIGEPVDATGTLQLDNVSPYYWNGVTLLAQAVTLPGGTVLPSQRTRPIVPAGTDLYTVTVAMVPHQFEWRREAHDIETGDLLPDAAVDGCALNGAGDIMNCNCTQGFSPVRAGVVPHPLPTTRWRDIPPATFALPGMAKIPLSGPVANQPQIVQLACKLKGLTTK